MEPLSEMNQQEWSAIKDRALAVAAEGITIADARLPGRPLIYVNEGFERLTGYTASDVLGRNCKFLQGAESDPDTIEDIRQALREDRDCTVEILNFRKDGSPFWNRLSITPVRDAEGTLTHYIGIQSDVTKRRLAEEQLTDANEMLARLNTTMQRELAEAATIQRAWLPEVLPQLDNYRFSWSFTPCTELGGDSLNVCQLDEYRVGMYVLDVSGHGAGAALLSASIQKVISSVPEDSCLFVRDDSSGKYDVASPSVVATTLNRQFQGYRDQGKFFTLLYGVLDLRDNSFCYVTAGHPAPLRMSGDRAEVCEQSDGALVGVFPHYEYGESRIQLEPGDRLLLFTDGATEALNEDEEMFDVERLLRCLEQQQALDPDAALDKLMDELRQWAGSHALDDDITLLMVDAVQDRTPTKPTDVTRR